VRELGGGDEAVAVAVEGAEGLGELRVVDGHGGAAGPRSSGAREEESSSNSMAPLPLASMAAMSVWISSPAVGRRPRERSSAASSSLVRLVSPSRSKRTKSSRSWLNCFLYFSIGLGSPFYIFHPTMQNCYMEAMLYHRIIYYQFRICLFH
jgi:hypothetical protein